MKTFLTIVILLFFMLFAICSFIMANYEDIQEIINETNNKNNTTDNK